MVENKELSSILIERGKEYGSFISNLEFIHKIKPGIAIYTDTAVSVYSQGFNNTIYSFVSSMLALKAARSVRASGEAFKDCINDFINYFTLTIDEVPGIEINLYEWCFDKNLINALNLRKKDKNLDLKPFNITKILNTNFASSLLPQGN